MLLHINFFVFNQIFRNLKKYLKNSMDYYEENDEFNNVFLSYVRAKKLKLEHRLYLRVLKIMTIMS